jgi:putative endonuclease
MTPAPSPGSRNLRHEGALGEDLAVRYLRENGYLILERNFRYRNRGEIDIIARDGQDLVFCEVKMRACDAYGLPEEAVTRTKQATIRRIASAYLALKGSGGGPCRFDVVSIRLGGNSTAITLLKNAF